LWDGSLALTSDITSIGNMMYSSHMVWLILAALIILLAMVGAIVITVSDKTRKGENN
jgi:NADH:ubiquinone oxidoreductase subunit 6 (subunit J)